MKISENIKIAGIDYDMNTPAVCIRDLEIDSEEWFFVTEQKKFVGCFWYEYFEGEFFDKTNYNSDIERFNVLSDLIIDWIVNSNVDYVALEGYSMGSKSSRLFQIGENTGILKKKLHDNFNNITIVAPTEIKKFATGKGNAKKEQMISAFLGAEDYDLFEIFNMNTVKKPIEDIVDSYWLTKLIESRIKKEKI